MQNHGVIVAADTLAGDRRADGARDGYHRSKGGQTARFHAAGRAGGGACRRARAAYALPQGARARPARSFHRSDAVLRLALEDVRKPFNPDQIVYCKAAPLELEAGGDVAKAFPHFSTNTGTRPRSPSCRASACSGLGKTKKEADTALSLFLDAVQIAAYAQGLRRPAAADGRLYELHSGMGSGKLPAEGGVYRRKRASDGR